MEQVESAGVAQQGGEASRRDLKKERTRRALMLHALRAFTQEGPDAVTIDELCHQAGVSRRTFFRYFASKEDVAMAPLQDLWEDFLTQLRAALDSCAPGDGVLPVLLEASTDAMGACAQRDAEWSQHVRLALQLDGAYPAFAAHNLGYCEDVSRRTSDLIASRAHVAPTGTSSPRMLVDMLQVAVRHAQRQWICESDASKSAEQLRAYTRSAVEALRPSLELTVLCSSPPADEH